MLFNVGFVAWLHILPLWGRLTHICNLWKLMSARFVLISTCLHVRYYRVERSVKVITASIVVQAILPFVVLCWANAWWFDVVWYDIFVEFLWDQLHLQFVLVLQELDDFVKNVKWFGDWVRHHTIFLYIVRSCYFIQYLIFNHRQDITFNRSRLVYNFFI